MRRGLRVTIGMAAVPAVGIALLSAGEMAGVLRDGADAGSAVPRASSGAIVLPAAEVLRKRTPLLDDKAPRTAASPVASVPATVDGSGGAATGAPTGAHAATPPASRPARPPRDAAAVSGRTVVPGRPRTTPPVAAAPVESAPAPAPASQVAAAVTAPGPTAVAARRSLRLAVKTLERIRATETAPAALQLGVSVIDRTDGKPAAGLPETVSVRLAVPAATEAAAAPASLHVRLAMLDTRAAGATDGDPLAPADVALRVRLAVSDQAVEKPTLKRTAAEAEAVSTTLHVLVPLEHAPVEPAPGESDPGEPGGEPAPQPAPEPVPAEESPAADEELAADTETAPVVDVVVPVSGLTAPGESTSHAVDVPTADPAAPGDTTPVVVDIEGSAPTPAPEPQAEPAPAPEPEPQAEPTVAEPTAVPAPAEDPAPAEPVPADPAAAEPAADAAPPAEPATP